MLSAVLPRLARPNAATMSQTPRKRIFGLGSMISLLPGRRIPRSWMQWQKSSVVAAPRLKPTTSMIVSPAAHALQT